jgi:hypothetical protein
MATETEKQKWGDWDEEAYSAEILPNFVRKLATKKCQAVGCQIQLASTDSFRLCEEHAEEEQKEQMGQAISTSLSAEHTFCVGTGGMIYSGLPDAPDIETSFRDLPIVKYHPDPINYKSGIKVGDLCHQMDLSNKVGTSFKCFICPDKQKHVVLPRDKRH